jgi:hypothetical protein
VPAPKKKPRKPARKAAEKPVKNSFALAAIRKAWEPGKR